MRYHSLIKFAIVTASLVCLARQVQATPVASPASGFTLSWNSFGGSLNSSTDAALAANGSSAFGSGQHSPNGGIHDIDNLIDGIYGNTNSWLSGANVATGETSFYVGVRLPQAFGLTQFAFGRDNGGEIGVSTDRTAGAYTIQFTTDPAVGLDSQWQTAGTVTIPTSGGNGEAADTNDSLRNLYSIGVTGGGALNATGFRIMAPSNAIIDELELYGTNLGGPTTYAPGVTAAPTGGFSITYNGNDGVNYSPTSATTVPNNLALASNGATAFADGALQPGGQHDIPKLNDGRYGNIYSWISNTGATQFAGIDLAGNQLYNISSIAFGRDNGLNSANGDADFRDRGAGVYTLQYTLLTSANASTGNTGDPITGWATVGTITIGPSSDILVGGGFSAYLRHEFDLLMGGLPITAGGMRLVFTNGNFILNGSDRAIDEIEIYGVAVPVPEPASTTLAVTMLTGVLIGAARRRQAGRNVARSVHSTWGIH
jgi:hypothetical protein